MITLGNRLLEIRNPNIEIRNKNDLFFFWIHSISVCLGLILNLSSMDLGIKDRVAFIAASSQGLVKLWPLNHKKELMSLSMTS